MSPMPVGDPWPAIEQVMAAEEQIRHGEDVDPSSLDLAPYWLDLLRLLQLYQLSKVQSAAPDRLAAVVAEMSTTVYDTYINKRAGFVVRA